MGPRGARGGGRRKLSGSLRGSEWCVKSVGWRKQHQFNSGKTDSRPPNTSFPLSESSRLAEGAADEKQKKLNKSLGRK